MMKIKGIVKTSKQGIKGTLRNPLNAEQSFEAGQKAEHDSFWDAFQENGKRKYYYSAFAGTTDASYGWNDVTFKPKYDIILNSGTYDNTMMFEYSPITNIKKSLEDCGVTMDFSKATWLNAPFRGAKTTHLPPIDVSSCTDFKMSFYSMPNLKALEIRNLNANCVFDRPMTFCFALEELRITGTIGTGTGGNSSINVQYSPLTKESLLNIIECLADKSADTSGSKWTVTIGSTNRAKLTEDEIYNATLKGWTLE